MSERGFGDILTPQAFDIYHQIQIHMNIEELNRLLCDYKRISLLDSPTDPQLDALLNSAGYSKRRRLADLKNAIHEISTDQRVSADVRGAASEWLTTISSEPIRHIQLMGTVPTTLPK